MFTFDFLLGAVVGGVGAFLLILFIGKVYMDGIETGKREAKKDAP